jgi:hypothetical protein
LICERDRPVELVGIWLGSIHQPMTRRKRGKPGLQLARNLSNRGK